MLNKSLIITREGKIYDFISVACAVISNSGKSFDAEVDDLVVHSGVSSEGEGMDETEMLVLHKQQYTNKKSNEVIMFYPPTLAEEQIKIVSDLYEKWMGRFPRITLSEVDSFDNMFVSKKQVVIDANVLTYAAQKGSLSVIQKFADAGVNLNQVSSNHITPLYVAVMYGQIGALRLLYRLGANLDISDSHGATPVHVAVATGQLDALNVLAELGANFNLPNKAGKTPIKIAEEQGKTIIYNRLKQLIEARDAAVAEAKGSPFSVTEMSVFSKQPNKRSAMIVPSLIANEPSTSGEQPASKMGRYGRYS
ncbi:MAG: ankyrin repeat domain-containing protein [Legionella sp.]|nr:ankyrin repeat domain-containing protein [Legionella sp.]